MTVTFELQGCHQEAPGHTSHATTATAPHANEGRPRDVPRAQPEPSTTHSADSGPQRSEEAINATGRDESGDGGLHGDFSALGLGTPRPSAGGPTAMEGPLCVGPTIYMGAAARQGSRKHMEDRYSLMPYFKPELPDDGVESDLPRELRDAAASRINACYFGIFDGHSAAQAADTAAARMHKVLAAELGQPRLAEEGDAVRAGIKRAFNVIDFEIICRARKEGECCGSTAVMALQLGATLYVAHAGDSEAVLERDGRAVLLAEAHKPDDPEELARIQAKGGKVDLVEQRIINPHGHGALNMSRSLGDPQYKAPRRRGDTMVILASDGLFDVMEPDEVTATVAHFLSTGNSELKAAAGGDAAFTLARAAAQDLVMQALRRGSRDNVTAVVGLLRWKDP